MTEIVVVVDEENATNATVTEDDASQSSVVQNETTFANTSTSNPTYVESISDIGNVDGTTVVDGSVLVFKATTNKWTSTLKLEQQQVEAGEY